MIEGTALKKEFGELISVSPARVTALLKRGLPVNADGRIPVKEGLAWIRANVDQTLRRPSSPQPVNGSPRAERSIIDTVTGSPEDLLNLLRRNSVILPKVAERLGFPPEVAAASMDLFDMMLHILGDHDRLTPDYGWERIDGTPEPTDEEDALCGRVQAALETEFEAMRRGAAQ